MLYMEENIRPPFSLDDARTIVRARYGIAVATTKELPSELDRNFHLVSASGGQYVLKIAHASVSRQALDLQNATLKHLAAIDLFPEVIASSDAKDMIETSSDDGHRYRGSLVDLH